MFKRSPNKPLLLTIVTLVACVVIAMLYLLESGHKNILPIAPDSVSMSTSSTGHNQIDERDPSNWRQYTNDRLGITFKYPATVKGEEMIVFELGNILFIAASSTGLYAHRDDLAGETDKDVLQHIEQVRKQLVSEGRWPYNAFWAIWVSDVNSESDLKAMIQFWFGVLHGYGDGCKLGDTQEAQQDGVYDIDVVPVTMGQAPGYEEETSSCWVNGRIVFKYSPTYHRAAIWDIGQEGHFLFSNCVESGFGCEADATMATSFAFTERK